MVSTLFCSNAITFCCPLLAATCIRLLDMCQSELLLEGEENKQVGADISMDDAEVVDLVNAIEEKPVKAPTSGTSSIP